MKSLGQTIGLLKSLGNEDWNTDNAALNRGLAAADGFLDAVAHVVRKHAPYVVDVIVGDPAHVFVGEAELGVDEADGMFHGHDGDVRAWGIPWEKLKAMPESRLSDVYSDIEELFARCASTQIVVIILDHATDEWTVVPCEFAATAGGPVGCA